MQPNFTWQDLSEDGKNKLTEMWEKNTVLKKKMIGYLQELISKSQPKTLHFHPGIIVEGIWLFLGA